MNSNIKLVNQIKKTIGVTLLEILLVLAIAAMVIIMSIRYYQSSITNQQTNSVSEMILAIVAAADSIALPKGSYDGVTDGTIKPLMPNQSMATPWNTDIVVLGAGKDLGITISGTPANVCNPLVARLSSTQGFTVTDATNACKTDPYDIKTTYSRTPSPVTGPQ